MNLSQNAIKVLERRYLKRDEEGTLLETPKDMFIRVARNIASAEKNYGKSDEEIREVERNFFDIMTDLDFLPNSPTLMNAGNELQQLAACFVLPVGDSMEKIFEAIKETALIQKSGGGVGYSFSSIRPKNDVVLSTKGISSGPISFMTVFNAATDTIKQGGVRRGANMGILRVDHPDILDFITCKEDSSKLTNFNISVGVTESFMKAIENNDEYDIVNPRTKEVATRYNARDIFKKIVKHAWRNGDPGIVFLDRLNKDNPTPNIGVIESTNPCGEQPLLPYEACNLGSINLAHMIKEEEGTVKVDYDKLRKVIHIAVRFLDDVIDMSKYPIEKIKKMAAGNRKIGLGVMGFADMLILLGIPYNSEEALELAQEVMSFIQDESKEASKDLAKERGSFPNFNGSVYDSPDGYKIRNATTTTIAPTGTLSIIGDCSSGVEPLFAISFVKNVMDNDKLVEVNKYFETVAKKGGFYNDKLMEKIAEEGNLEDISGVPSNYKRIFVTAHEITPIWHVRMQASFQEFVDNAVSKTVNFPSTATEKDVEDVYMLAYRLGCKGITIYRDRSREGQILRVEGKDRKESKQEISKGAESVGKSDEGGSALVSEKGLEEKTSRSQVSKQKQEEGKVKEDEKSGEKPVERIKPRPRPDITQGFTKKYDIGGCGKLYVTVNSDDYGICEVFTNTGEEGCAALSEAISRLISVTIRSGIDLNSILKQVQGIRCITCIADDKTHVLSCPDAIGKAIEYYLKGSNKFDLDVASGPRSIMICPEEGCGGIMEPEGGCYVCRNCGFSKCS
ncbi:MAG: vitamin B12-dependent ribonucleotide reductase [Actinobacteria bacterium]|nr:vitamin B12-dependent ribonucleotide reductase [Actinomycetota bacterium]